MSKHDLHEGRDRVKTLLIGDFDAGVLCKVSHRAGLRPQQAVSLVRNF